MRHSLRLYPCSLALALTSLLACDARQPERSPTDVPREDATTPNEPTADPGSISAAPLAAATTTADAPRFEILDARRTGLDFRHVWDAPPEYASELGYAFAGGGACVGDYDGDGLTDVLLTRPFGGPRLYRNLGDFRFEDVTRGAGLNDDSWSSGCSFADVDGDTDLDLYICGYDCANRLYINQGDGTFREEARRAGVAFEGASTNVAFADYDTDGDLDAYLVTNRMTHREPPGRRDIDAVTNVVDGRRRIKPEYRELLGVMDLDDGAQRIVLAGQADRLFRNDGGGRFTDVTREAGLRGFHPGLSATWWDYDDDGKPDLYVANDFFDPDQLWRNLGDGRFEEVSARAIPHTPWFSMGTDSADINNDGWADFLATDMSGTTHYKQKVAMGDMSDSGWFLVHPKPRQYMRNAVYLNTGAGSFMEIAKLAKLSNSDWTWSVKFGDLDNDGWVDLFTSNGMTRQWQNSDLRNEAKELERRAGNPAAASARFWLKQDKRSEANLAFRNGGDLRFESVGPEWGLDLEGVTFGAAMADLDGDGDLDLVLNNFDGPATVYRNNSPGPDEGVHRIRVRLRGTVSNAHGVGSTLHVEAGGQTQTRHVSLARSYMSGADAMVHFGLGDADRIDRLTVRWPSGHRQVFDDLAADQLYTVTEPTGEPDAAGATASSKPFRELTRLRGLVRHAENEFNDYARQPLLPAAMSQLGPGVAVGDANGDGLDDLFVGAAAGSVGSLCQNDGKHGFTVADSEWLEADRDREDMAPLFFDADGDGDLDLYVVSGGYELEPGDERLRDRLYWNDGGRFTRADDDVLPDRRDCGSVVVAADYDRDGDLDLFVGSRVIPGRYPLTPESCLLRNDGGRFVDVTDETAPGLRLTGLVTSALWSDADDDGWLDLLVTHDWGPVKLFSNDEGRMEERTARAGLEERLGWYQSIAGGDLDHDGDIDYAVANVALNTKYHASPEHPTFLYYGDFENNGEPHLVEAEFEDETLFPVRGRSCSSQAMPMLGDKFPTFDSFAIATLDEIYTPSHLDTAHRFVANSLESGLLVNDGDARFEFQPLPTLAQVSPGQGIVVTDANGDRHPDLLISHNSYAPQAETGRWHGGVGVLLLGRGDATFETVWPNDSGVLLPVDAKGTARIDVDDDGCDDVVVTANDDAVRFLRGESPVDRLTIRASMPGNPTGVGARITLDGDVPQTVEVYAGGGYLSQDRAAVSFARPQENTTVRVRWPDGEVTEQAVVPSASTVHLRRKE